MYEVASHTYIYKRQLQGVCSTDYSPTWLHTELAGVWRVERGKGIVGVFS